MKAWAVLIAALVAASPAMAHAFLETASPAAGENLKTPPAKVELHFSEALEATFSAVTVTNEAGLDMGAGPIAVDGTEMDLPLRKLAPGRYRVTWHAVSIDTHRTEGRYNFLVLP